MAREGHGVAAAGLALCTLAAQAQDVRAGLAGYAAAMLDETRIDRAWLVKLLGEADPPSSPSDAWWPLEGAEGIGVYWDDDAWCLYLDEGVFFVRSTRADALAFFKLVRWPVEPGKILEGAKT